MTRIVFHSSTLLGDELTEEYTTVRESAELFDYRNATIRTFLRFQTVTSRGRIPAEVVLQVPAHVCLLVTDEDLTDDSINVFQEGSQLVIIDVTLVNSKPF